MIMTMVFGMNILRKKKNIILNNQLYLVDLILSIDINKYLKNLIN